MSERNDLSPARPLVAAPASGGSGDHVEILPAVGGGFLVLRNGYQWGNDPTLFDHGIGCSTQVFKTEDDAWRAIKEAR